MRVGSMVGCVTALLLMQAGGAGAERIYRFVDRDGVTHLSNVPDDVRYRLYYQGAQPASVRRAPPRDSEPIAVTMPEPDMHGEEDLLTGQDAGIPGAIDIPDAVRVDRK